jgi:hypothetical protein
MTYIQEIDQNLQQPGRVEPYPAKFLDGRVFLKLECYAVLLTFNHEHFYSVMYYNSRLDADRCDENEVRIKFRQSQYIVYDALCVCRA